MMRDIKFGNGTDSVGDGGRVSFVDRQCSLIETSITVPAVNATFYACARGGTIVSRCRSAATLLAPRNSFRFESPAGCRSFRLVSNIGAKSPRPLRNSVPSPCLPEYGSTPFEKIEIYFYIICESKAENRGGTSDSLAKPWISRLVSR